jgi:hypothetical protein
MDDASRGLVTAIGPGGANVTATLGGLSGTVHAIVSQLAIAASAATFRSLQDGVGTFNAVASSILDPSLPVLWKVTLIERDAQPGLDLPAVGQSLYYFTGTEIGADPSRPETWTASSTTDTNGVAWFGPTSGFRLGNTSLSSDGGAAVSFRSKFAQAGAYTITFELMDVTTPAVPMRSGTGATVDLRVQGCVGFSINTICADDESPLIIFGASTVNNIDPNIGPAVEPQTYTVRPDGSDLRQVTPTSTDFSVAQIHATTTRSPDRKLVAWVDGRGLQSAAIVGLIWVANADGSNPHRLTMAIAADCHEANPTFSPDSQWIAFERTCGHPYPLAENQDYQFVIRADGSDERVVLIPGVTDMPPPAPVPVSGGATFSPDSSTVYVGVSSLGTKGPYIYAWSLADASVQKVLDLTGESYNPYLRGNLMVLPNGDLLYEYASDSPLRLERIHPDGTGRETVRNIAINWNHMYVEDTFAVSPDGTRVVYGKLDHPDTDQASRHTYGAWVSDLDGSNAMPLGHSGFAFWTSRWVP